MMRSPVFLFLSIVSIGVSLPFTEWLDQFRLDIGDLPEITLDNIPTLGSATIDIQSGACHNISLGVLSVADAVGSSLGFATNFTLDGFGLKCEMTMSMKTGIIPTGLIDIDFAVLPGLVSAGFAIPAAQNESAPLPAGANLTACSAPLVLNLHATGHTIAGQTVAKTINKIASEFTPDLWSGAICGTAGQLVDRLINQTFRNVSSKLAASGALVPAQDALEPTMSPSATNINQLLETGDFGRALQVYIHHGRYDVSNTTQLLELISGFGQILKPGQNSPLKRVFDGAEQLRAMEGVVPFSFESAVGGLTAGLSLGTCGGGPMPSPILAGSTTDHAQRFTSGHFNGHCGGDLNFTLKPQAVELGNGSVNISFGELDVTTSVNAAVEGLSFYFSLLVGIDGYTMLNDYGQDQWFDPACLVGYLDEKKPENFRLLGVTGAISSAMLDLAALDQDPTLGGLLQGVSHWANALLEAYQPALDLLLKGSGTSSIVNLLNGKIHKWLTSSDVCAPTMFNNPVSKPMIVGSGVWTAVFAGLSLVLAGVFLVQWFVQRRKVAGGQALLTPPAEEASPEAREASADSLSAQARGEGAVSASVLATALWAMNFLLLGVTGLMILSVFAPSSVMKHTVTDTNPLGGGPQAQTGEMTLEFTLWSLAIDLARYGEPGITVIIVIGNLVLPVCQMAALLACWNLPPSALSVKRRGQILGALLMMFKGGYVGTFINGMIALGMGARLTHDDGAGGTAQFIMETAPGSGFYLYSAAIVAGHVSLEIISSRHLKMVEGGGEGKKVVSGSGVAQGGLEAGGAEAESEALPSKAPLCSQVERSATSALTWLFVLVSPVLLVCAISLNIFSVGIAGSFQGAMSWMMGNDVVSDFSVFTATTRFPWPIAGTGAIPLQVGYFLTIIILGWFLIAGPVLLSLMHIICWVAPLSPSGHRKAMRRVETMNNWQTLEIYIFVVILMSFLDSSFASAFLSITQHSSAMAGFCTNLEENDTGSCVSMEIDMMPGMWVLGAAVISCITTKVLIEKQSKSVLGE